MAEYKLDILVLDDDHRRLSMFREWCAGHRGVFVETAQQAIAELQEKKFNVVFLDHDLGGEVYVTSKREDCGMEVVRQIVDGHTKVSEHTFVIVHTLNHVAGQEMVDKLKDKGIGRPMKISYLEILCAGGPTFEFGYGTQ